MDNYFIDILKEDSLKSNNGAQMKSYSHHYIVVSAKNLMMAKALANKIIDKMEKSEINAVEVLKV